MAETAPRTKAAAAAGRSAAERVRIDPAKPWEIVSMRQRMITGGRERAADGGRQEAGLPDNLIA